MIKYNQIDDYIINNRALQLLLQLGVIEKAIVYYHENCMDGSCSAALMSQVLNHKKVEQITFIAVNYGKEFPMDTVDESALCFMVDFSASAQVLEQIQAKSKGLLIIDHHKSAVEAILKYQETETPKFGYILGGTKHSGASLIHEVLIKELGLAKSTVPMEQIVYHCRIHDTWQHNGNIVNTSYGFVTAAYGACENEDKIQASKNMLEFIDGFFRAACIAEETALDSRSILREIESFSNIGLRMLKLKDHEANAYMEYSKHCLLRQGERVYNFVTVKAPYRAANMVATNGFMKYPNTDFMAIYEDKPDSEDYVISLRSRNGGADVSEVAKFYGGGGHATAAGFKIKKEEFDAIINRYSVKT